VINPDIDALRIFLHVVAMAVWVGGQLVMIGIVGAVRPTHRDALPSAARGFARVAWPAFAISIVTGIWNLLAVDVAHADTDYQVTLFVKVSLVAISGIAAAIHQLGRSRLALALGGAIGLLSALGAALLGVLIRSG
jgi:putative copper export protein